MKKIAFLLFAFVFSLAACKKDKTTDPKPDPYRVKYSIVCTDCTVIYYYDENGNDTIEYHKNSNWSYSFTGKLGQPLILFAYNTSNTPQGVTTSISLRDTVIATQTTYCAINGSSFCSDTIR